MDNSSLRKGITLSKVRVDNFLASKSNQTNNKFSYQPPFQTSFQKNLNIQPYTVTQFQSNSYAKETFNHSPPIQKEKYDLTLKPHENNTPYKNNWNYIPSLNLGINTPQLSNNEPKYIQQKIKQSTENTYMTERQNFTSTNATDIVSTKTSTIPENVLTHHRHQRSTSSNFEEKNLQADKSKQNHFQQLQKQLESQKQMYNERLKKLEEKQIEFLRREEKFRNSSVETFDRQKFAHVKIYETKIEKLQVQKSSLFKKNIQLSKNIHQQQVILTKKIRDIQMDLKMMQSSKNRLKIQNQNLKKVIEQERSRLEKNQVDKNKLIFFKEDLIHAKDFDRLKIQMEDLKNENEKMYEQHLEYIQLNKKMKKDFDKLVMKFMQDLRASKEVQNTLKNQIQEINNKSLQGIDSIKLQNQINILQKKNQQLKQNLSEKEQIIIETKDNLKQAIREANSNKNSMLEQYNIKQIKATIALYQQRIEALNESLEIKNAQLDKQKKTIQYFSSQLRKNRQDIKISSKKQLNNDQNLKNQIQNLKRIIENEKDIYNKKTKTLEQITNNKMKEIVSKDKFIKNFLIGRLNNEKKIDEDNLLRKIDSYFLNE